MRTVALYTLGCKVSQYETEAIAERFRERGFLVVPFGAPADAYVINPCTVTEESDRKSRKIIRRAIAASPNAVVAALGCYTQRASREVAAIAGVDIVIGTEDKLSVVDLVVQKLKERGEQIVSAPPLDGAKFEKMRITGAPRTRAYVKIEDGCECRCTYCAIAPARGPVRSKSPKDVICEVEALYSTGTREIVLTGIETGSYGIDLDPRTSLSELIAELDRRGSCERIRLGSMAPELVGRDFLEGVRGARILAPHLHMSLQSGSDRVLARMKRRYNRARAIENMYKLREAIPGMQLTCDLMVGFPGESESDFEGTVDLVREVGMLSCHVFAYSRRAGTPAADYDGQIEEGEKRRRSRELIRVAGEVRASVLDGVVDGGSTHTVIVEEEREGGLFGHSESFVEFLIPGARVPVGDAVSVAPVSHNGETVVGRII